MSVFDYVQLTTSQHTSLTDTLDETVSAVLRIVASLEAKLGTNASTILVTIASSRSPNKVTIRITECLQGM